MAGNMLEVKDLKVHYEVLGNILPENKEYIKAVDGVSFNIGYGETLGLVGESGCGKSTIGRGLLRLVDPKGGQVTFEGKDVLSKNKKELKNMRKDMQLIFQDPFGSLNPRLSIGEAIDEVLYVHKYGSKDKRRKRTEELIELVGLHKKHLSRYPHEFSGGQRQRIVIARALAVEPKFIVCDEPVSALDVSIQSQVINLLDELQKKLNLTYLFIGHDLSVINHISDRIAVMYLGKIVETGKSEEVFTHPRHPYTKALLSAIPMYDVEFDEEVEILEGDIPSPINPPSGCRFHTRCVYKEKICKEVEPTTRSVGAEHTVACHFEL